MRDLHRQGGVKVLLGGRWSVVSCLPLSLSLSVVSVPSSLLSFRTVRCGLAWRRGAGDNEAFGPLSHASQGSGQRLGQGRGRGRTKRCGAHGERTDGEEAPDHRKSKVEMPVGVGVGVGTRSECKGKGKCEGDSTRPEPSCRDGKKAERGKGKGKERAPTQRNASRKFAKMRVWSKFNYSAARPALALAREDGTDCFVSGMLSK